MMKKLFEELSNLTKSMIPDRDSASPLSEEGIPVLYQDGFVLKGPDWKPTLYDDGTVTYWSISAYKWMRRVSRIPDDELAAMEPGDREKVEAHLGRKLGENRLSENEGREAFWTVKNGKIHMHWDDDMENDISVSWHPNNQQEVKAARKLAKKWNIKDGMCSSSCDFPEEYGMKGYNIRSEIDKIL